MPNAQPRKAAPNQVLTKLGKPLKAYQITAGDFARVKANVEKHHRHDIQVTNGVTAVFYNCACGFRHAEFK